MHCSATQKSDKCHMKPLTLLSTENLDVLLNDIPPFFVY